MSKTNNGRANYVDVEWCFLDIGGTLGIAALNPLKLTLFSTTKAMLDCLKNVLGLKLGVITNVPMGIVRNDVAATLADANVLVFFESAAIITSADVHGMRPDVKIYDFAAETVRASLASCLYVGDEVGQVNGAIQAGMSGIVKP